MAFFSQGRSTYMASPLYLWLKGGDGTPIRGSSEVMGREGSIEVLSVVHGMHAPIDGNTGRLTGSRVHQPLSIEKDIDKATPVLYRAISRGETFSEAVLSWYRVNEAGIEILLTKGATARTAHRTTSALHNSISCSYCSKQSASSASLTPRVARSASTDPAASAHPASITPTASIRKQPSPSAPQR
ncbi:type VI secretion system tube protein Hcp [Paraburkholderia sp. J63]|uniref:Hcp family type VI secretion system effector n=1 Tax=Paraburkholderia sp. J63 TaxID=2805434 RepID=UPI002ABD24D9|nr:type VI secretion system tube protein Hcp [Paraburkholderia sp. J63]